MSSCEIRASVKARLRSAYRARQRFPSMHLEPPARSLATLRQSAVTVDLLPFVLARGTWYPMAPPQQISSFGTRVRVLPRPRAALRARFLFRLTFYSTAKQ